MCEGRTYFCDYLDANTNKIIEINGTFWHMKPSLFKPSDVNSVIKKTAQEIWDSDTKRANSIINKGYKILVIWEDDLNTNYENEVQRAKHFLEGRI